MTRSRRAGPSRDETRHQPLYARVLRLRYLAPGGFLCFVFLEGAVALGILLALAELVSWWGVLVLPAMVAAMVKLNDVVAGALIRPPAAVRATPTPAGRTSPSGAPGSGPSGAETVRLSPTVVAQIGAAGPPPAGRPWLRSATFRQAADGMGPDGHTEEHWTAPGVDGNALNGPPVTRHWTEDLDERAQRARQSAARRYE